MVYVDDIVITKIDTTRITQLKGTYWAIFRLKILVIWNT